MKLLYGICHWLSDSKEPIAEDTYTINPNGYLFKNILESDTVNVTDNRCNEQQFMWRETISGELLFAEVVGWSQSDYKDFITKAKKAEGIEVVWIKTPHNVLHT